MRLLLPLLLLFLNCYCLRAATYTYDYNRNCATAYTHFLSLQLSEGHAAITGELKANPNNLMAVYVADYEDCISLLINCDRDEYERKEALLGKRLDMVDKGSAASPWYRFCKAGLYFHRAIINVRMGDNLKAALALRRSFALQKENRELFPAFEHNNIYRGLQEAVIGSLPGNYKWMASIFGMSGSVRKGTDMLAAFVGTHNSGHPMYAEAVLYYLYVRFYLAEEKKEAWEYLNSQHFVTTGNLLHAFVKANIALDYQKADAALETLNAAAAVKDYHAYAIFDYQKGMALLTRLDTSCAFYLNRYLQKNRSDAYIKEAWQKMGFIWYIHNDMQRANACLAQAKKQGSARIDADKQAQRFAEANAWPLSKLLQVRLLTDGGYYERAKELLSNIDLGAITNPGDKAEYYYRSGKVYEELAASNPGKQYYQSALSNYTSAIKHGQGRHEQFAARAALQMGKTYERLGMRTEALVKYEECLDMPSHDFQNSIDQQAKAGVNRLKQ
jgi:hypothetical protein